MTQLEKLKAALAEFRRVDAELWRVIRERPTGDAGRARFEIALAAVVKAGDRLAEARALLEAVQIPIKS